MHWRASHRLRHRRNPHPRGTVARGTVARLRTPDWTQRKSPWESSPWVHNLCWRRTRQLTPSPWRSSKRDFTTWPRESWRVAGTWGMRGGRWRWWRGQGSQRKRSLHAWMRWDKHSDILSRAMCARNECDNARLRRLTTTRTFTCSPSVSRHCRVSGALCWSWFSRCHSCRTSHRSAGRFYTSTSFHHAYAIPSTKSFLLDVGVRLCLVIVNLIRIPNSCIFHIAKTGLLRCCLYTPRRLQ